MMHARVAALVGPALATAVGLLLVGCAVLPSGAQSPSQLASGAFQNWNRAAAIQFKGHLSVYEGTIQFRVTETRDGTRGEGTGTLDCDRTNCMLQARVESLGGAPRGTSTLQITAHDRDTNGSIASCTADIPAIRNGENQAVACTISGDAWTVWAGDAAAKGDQGLFTVTETAAITANPPYVA